ncbi:SpaA isopeptide-forming pilin-related protein, partial [Lactococcus hircilactis]
TNTNYSGVYSPYTYNMTGAITPTSLAKSFSSMEMILGWDRTTTQNLAKSNNWTRYDYNLTVPQITYNDTNGKPKTVVNNSGTITYTTIVTPSGSWFQSTEFILGLGEQTITTVPNDNGGAPITAAHYSLDYGSPSDGSVNFNYGKGQLYTGQKIILNHFDENANWGADPIRQSTILMWDPSAFSYDPTQGSDIVLPYSEQSDYSSTPGGTLSFGVANTFASTPPVTMKVLSYDATSQLYKWYSTWAAVVAAGMQNQVSAVNISVRNPVDGPVVGYNANVRFLGVPAVVKTGIKGSKTPNGNPLVLLAASKDTDLITGNTFDPMINGGTSSWMTNTGNSADNGTYIPTTFNSDGSVNNMNGTIGGKTYTQQYVNTYGDSAFVMPYSITSRTTISQPSYQTSQDIKVKIQGIPSSGSSATTYDSNLVTTLPVGIHYKSGSAVDASSNPLPDPTLTTNASGQEVLQWNFNKMSQTLMATGTEVDFKATSTISQLSFNSQGLTGTLVVTTVASMWIDGQPANVDGTGSDTSVRQSTAGLVEQLIQQVTLDKEADKTAIEDGPNDAAITDPTARAASTDITYTVTGGNYSVNAQPALTIMDVLPYDGDSRGSKLHGGYTIQSVKIVDSNGNVTGKDSAGNPVTLNYTDTAPNTSGSNNYNEKTNPNTIMGTPPSSGTWSSTQTGWKQGTPDANAKAIIAADPSLAIGASITLQITIRPTGQQAGDVYDNRASLNSTIINAPVTSQNFRTTVYGRDLSGFAWRDVNHDGLYESGEPKLSGIPVKLFRTSLVNASITNQVVTSDLKGNSFVDSSGNSTVLTGTDGSYTFSNLPEGTYVAEFEVAGMIQKKQFVITNPNVGTALPINSKSAQNSPYNTATSTYGTDSDLDTLQSLSGLSDSTQLNYLTNDTYHMQYANLGVVQGEIYLLKFKLGTTADTNNDGSPDIDSNYHLTQGTPLPGASFNLLDSSGALVQSLTTDAYGQIHFTNVAPGNYSLVETKAPAGYELLKAPISVTVDMSKNNGTTVVYAADAPMTVLPFTGANGPMGIFLIIASTLLVAAMGLVISYYYRPKRQG